MLTNPVEGGAVRTRRAVFRILFSPELILSIGERLAPIIVIIKFVLYCNLFIISDMFHTCGTW